MCGCVFVQVIEAGEVERDKFFSPMKALIFINLPFAIIHRFEKSVICEAMLLGVSQYYTSEITMFPLIHRCCSDSGYCPSTNISDSENQKENMTPATSSQQGSEAITGLPYFPCSLDYHYIVRNDHYKTL